VNSPASIQDNYEAMTPTQTSVNQQQIAAANLNGNIKRSSFIEKKTNQFSVFL